MNPNKSPVHWVGAALRQGVTELGDPSHRFLIGVGPFVPDTWHLHLLPYSADTHDVNGETAARLEAPMQLSLARGGLSAAAEADARQEAIDLVTDELDRMQTLLGALKSDQAKWRAGAAGEAQVVEVLLDIGRAGWFVLADRRWPGTAKANLDVVVVGPGGVFVIDVKTWRDARVESGTLWHGQVNEGAALLSMLDQCGAVEDVLSAAG